MRRAYRRADGPRGRRANLDESNRFGTDFGRYLVPPLASIRPRRTRIVVDFPRSIRTHGPDHNTVGNLEREVVHRNEIPEAPGQPICGQRAHGSVRAVDVISADFFRVEEGGVLEPVLCR
jgi:hypothetical protein